MLNEDSDQTANAQADLNLLWVHMFDAVLSATQIMSQFRGWETSGLIPISRLKTSILSIKFQFYTRSQDHLLCQK